MRGHAGSPGPTVGRDARIVDLTRARHKPLKLNALFFQLDNEAGGDV
jgi:hypothetical protein